MLRINDVIIDLRTVGNKFWLTEIVPVRAFVNGERTDTVSGHKYVIALPERNLEKIGVKISGPQLLEAPESGFVEVKFDNLELYFYWQNNQPQVGARATGISLVNTKA
ncbi:MAG TPA: hypothetical protein DD738_03505 [Ruminiclostridium sp.]|nr:hypothetical protein [Ruminiclostridium sp.]